LKKKIKYASAIILLSTDKKKFPLNQLDTLVAFPMPSISLASKPNIVGEKSYIQLA
jgi:hypothetical protein